MFKLFLFVISPERTGKTGQMSVRQRGVNIFKNLMLRDCWVDVNETWQASKQASLFAQSTNKDITSMNNVQGHAARKAHKAQHCWPPCKRYIPSVVQQTF